MNRRALIVLLVMAILLLTGCGPAQASTTRSQQATSTGVSSAKPVSTTTSAPTARAASSAAASASTSPSAAVPAAAIDYGALSKDEKTKALLNNVWQNVGEGNFRLGYYELSEADMAGKHYYFRFYADGTMHEWSDNKSWNRAYKWSWTSDDKIKVTNYADQTGKSASSWYFEKKYLLNHNLNTQDLIPMIAQPKFPEEPVFNKT